MDSIRRTVPRSAHRAPRQSTASQVSGLQAAQALASTTQLRSERYVPSFEAASKGIRSSSQASAGGGANETKVSPIRIESELVDLDAGRSAVDFGHACQSCVRWLRVGGREAIAIAGATHGVTDAVRFFGVSVDERGLLSQRCCRALSHEGNVSALHVGSDGLVAIGSERGGVSVLRGDRWNEDVPERIGRIGDMRRCEEGVVGIACLGDKVCVAGEHGSLCLIAAETEEGATEMRFQWGERFDDVTLCALDVVDESAQLVVGGGAAAVSVWDVRNGVVASRVCHPHRAVSSCVAVDASQPHFIVAGFQNGEVCVWDRRGGLNGGSGQAPISRVAVHEGPVWDVGVVGGGNPGRLVTCGEDGMVLLVDYAAAAARSKGAAWSGSGEFWRAEVCKGDVRSLIGKSYCSYLGVNSVAAHHNAELFAYAGDNATVCFSTFS